MRSTALALPGVLLIQPDVYADERGCFWEAWSACTSGLSCTFVQDNCSFSQAGVLRGLHAQHEPYAQAKLVGVLNGAAFDVAVDVDERSPTFGQYVSALLTGENHHMLFIPAGYAHGFLALEDTLLSYKCSAPYSPNHEYGIRYDDPALAIAWPQTPRLVSPKDLALPFTKWRG